MVVVNKLRALYVLFWLNFRRTYKVLPAYLRGKCRSTFVGMAILATLEVATMLSISFLAMSIAAPEAALSFGFMPYLINNSPAAKLFFADPRNVAMFGSCYVVGLLAIKNLTAYLMLSRTAYFGEMVALNIGERLFRNYLFRNYIDHLAGKGTHIYSMIGMRNAVGQYMVACMNVYTYFATFMALLFLIVSRTPVMLFFVLGLVGVASTLLYFNIKRAIDRDSNQVMQLSMRENQSLSNATGGVREIIIYRQQEVFLDIFRHNARAKMKPQSFLSTLPTIPTLTLEVVGFFSIPCLAAVLIYWYQAPMAQIASTLALFMLFCWRVLPMLNRSITALVLMRSLHASAFTCLTEVENLEAAVETETVLPDNTFQVMEKISLDTVSFRYPGKERFALDGVTCDARLGRRIGIVGLSGAGKSTLASVLAGLVAPSSGCMLVDGRQLTPATLPAYRQRIGYVPQSAFIMNGTLAQNIAFSEWGKSINKEKVLHAAELAALDFIHENPQGIEMSLSAGSQLSGGQMQRVSIARALYVSPQIIILDESTSALDLATERAVLHTIENLPRDLIVFVIAHRLSTVERCDEIWWLEGGRLRQQGPAAKVLPEYTAYLASRPV